MVHHLCQLMIHKTQENSPKTKNGISGHYIKGSETAKRHYSAQASYFGACRGIRDTKIEKSRGIQDKKDCKTILDTLKSDFKVSSIVLQYTKNPKKDRIKAPGPGATKGESFRIL